MSDDHRNDGKTLADQVNRGVRARNRRVSFHGEVPFGRVLRMRYYSLGNGLRVIAMPDRSAPVVSYQTWFRVGSRHETPGKTGLAHLFEHLMFGGTERFPPGELDRRLEEVGAETNAATWVDWTYYYANIPKSALALTVELEADRMAHLVLRSPEVESEKEVVANERRLRVEDDLEGSASETLYATAFRRHAYHWPTIGWMEDIHGFTVQDCQRFYRTFYSPNNTTLVVVGDFDERELLQLIQEHYGAQRPIAMHDSEPPREPAQRAQRKVELKRPTATTKMAIGYRAMPFGDASWEALGIVNEVLLGGRSSRLYQRLVHDLELCSDVHGSVAPFRDGGLYELWLAGRPGVSASRLLAALDEHLDAARCTRPLEGEVEKAKSRLELGFLHGLETASGKAEQIGFYDTLLGQPERIFARLDAYRRISPEDALQAAQLYLDPRRRSIVTIEASSGAS